MKWNPPDISVLNSLDKELAPLRKQHDAIEKKIHALCTKRAKIWDEVNKEVIDALPKDMNKWSKEQWAWILETGHGEGTCHYNFKSKLINDMGMSCFGFYPETSQPDISIHEYGFRDKGFKDKVFNGLKTLMPHLKPVTVVDARHGKETGIRLSLHGLGDETTSVAYIHDNGAVALYINSYDKPKEFESLKALLDWYEDRLSTPR